MDIARSMCIVLRFAFVVDDVVSALLEVVYSSPAPHFDMSRATLCATSCALKKAFSFIDEWLTRKCCLFDVYSYSLCLWSVIMPCVRHIVQRLYSL